MMARWLLALLVSLFAFAPAPSVAAASAQPLTPLYTSVLGGEQQVYSVRFFDALGQPSVGETVYFVNDACGFFQNGGFSVAVVTDTTGVASATFTARPQGITCRSKPLPITSRGKSSITVRSSGQVGCGSCFAHRNSFLVRRQFIFLKESFDITWACKNNYVCF